jgi:hypothetical protein
VKDIIFLEVSPYRVERMTKKLPRVARGNIPVKITIEVKPDAFREPVVSQEIVIEDWREGVTVSDIELREHFITEAEAAEIRRQRRQAQVDQLRELGYKVEEPEGTES